MASVGIQPTDEAMHARYGDTFGTEDSGADHTINRIDELLPILDDLAREQAG